MSDTTKPPSGPDGAGHEVAPYHPQGDSADVYQAPSESISIADENPAFAPDAANVGNDSDGPDDERQEEAEAAIRSHLKGIIEALVFASDTPMSPSDIAKAAKANRKMVVELLREVQGDFDGRGIRLVEVAGGFAFRTAPAFGQFVRDVSAQRPVKMTRAQLETLAIVAYRQPMTRPEIDEIRGVDSGPVLKVLLERGLVRILGKRDEPGRPLIYGTTAEFLSFFSLKSLKELPSLRDFSELSDESKRVFEQTLGEEAPEQIGPLEPSMETHADSQCGSDSNLNAPAVDLSEGSDRK